MHSILIVDDHVEGSAEPLAKLLKHEGHTALCVPSGAQAIVSLKAHVPRLVILDVMMPGMDGMEVLRRIRGDRRTEDVPVVIFSAIADPKFIDQVKEQGANDYWVKGEFDFRRLAELVAPYLDAHPKT